MFKISKLTDYSLRIMVHLAACEGGLQSASQVASTNGIGEATVRKVLKRLNEGGLVVSTQGAGGGYRLRSSLDRITLLDLITVMEGEVAITDCSQQQGCCIDAAACGFQQPWRLVNDKVHALLADIYLSDMLQSVDRELTYYPRSTKLLRSQA